MGDREAEVLLQIDEGTLSEVRGKERVIVAKHVEVLVVAIVPTPEELESAREQLGLPPGSLSADGRPLVFVLAGEYKIPVSPTVPTIKEDDTNFVFAVPNLWMAVSFPTDADAEIIEAFEMLIKMHGVLRQKSVSNRSTKPAPSTPSPATPPVATAAPTTTSPSSQQQRDLPAGGYGAPPPYGSPATGQQGIYTPSGVDNGALMVEQPQHKPRLSTKVALGVGAIAGFAVKGIRKGTQLATGAVGKGSDKIVEHTDACEKPVEVPQEYKQKVTQARMVTKSAVLVSGGLATAMVGVAAVLGSGAVGVAGKILPKGGGPASTVAQSETFEGVKEVGGAVVGSAATVFVEASDAARTILTATCGGISKVVSHKYGADVGQATEDTLGLVQDGVAVQQNIKNIGAKALAKNAAKHAGKEFLEKMENEGTDGTTPKAPQIEEPGQPAYYSDQQQAQAPPPQAQEPPPPSYAEGYNPAYGQPQSYGQPQYQQ